MHPTGRCPGWLGWVGVSPFRSPRQEGSQHSNHNTSVAKVLKHFDAIVVGCGGMGSSVSYHLASHGIKVLNIDKFGLNHGFGSSHGKTRIIRLAYFEDPRYVPLLRRAYDLWRSLQELGREEIISITGGLMIGPPEGKLLTGVLRSAQSHGIPHRVLTGIEAAEEFPAFSLDERHSAVYDPMAGIIFPENSVAAHVRLASQSGAEFRFGEPMTGLKKTKEGYEVTTSRDSFSSDKVVLCAGPWMNGLLGRLFPLAIERQVLFWFAGEDDRFSRNKMPVFIMDDGVGRFFYGIPDCGDGVKVARHHGGTMVDPDKIDRRVTSLDAGPVQDFTLRHMPGLRASPVSSSVCMYANTPDDNFVVDFHPGFDGVVIVSACSGHGFKFASALGEVVADLVSARRPSIDISFLGLGRFKAPSPRD